MKMHYVCGNIKWPPKYMCCHDLCTISNQYVYHIKHDSSFSTIPKVYQHVLSLVFAVKEINENSQILPNVSLGFQIYDSYLNTRMTSLNTLKLLTCQNRTVSNFNCDESKNLIAIIGGLTSEISLQIANTLEFYKVPQVKRWR